MSTPTITVTTAQAADILRRVIPLRRPVLLEGPPGVGKTALCTQAAQVLTAPDGAPWDFISTVVPLWGGIPTLPDFHVGAVAAQNGHARRVDFVPVGEIAEAMYATRPTVLLLDEAFSGSDSDVKVAMQLTFARKINGLCLPDCVHIVAATNGRAHRAGNITTNTAALSRYATILHVVPNLEDWIRDFALPHGIEPVVIAYLRNTPGAFHEFTPGAEMENFPCSRSWEQLSAQVPAMTGAAPQVELATYAGAVGPGRGVEFVTYLRMWHELASFDAILLDPQGAPVPDQPDRRYAVASMLAHYATPQTIGRILAYCERLRGADAQGGKFAVYAVQDARRKTPSIELTSEWQAMWSGPLGRLIRGEE